MVDIARLGYEVDTSDVSTASRQLDEFARENVNAAKAASRVGPAAKTSGAAIAQAGRNARGYGRQVGSSAAHTANLTAQLNDIGVMLAAGQNPLQLALQQGTQVNQVFAQMGGGAAAIRGIGAAFVSMVNPVSLATLGIIAGGAALVQWGMKAFEAGDEAQKLSERLEDVASAAEAARLSLRADLLLVSDDELTLLDNIKAKVAEVGDLREEALNAASEVQQVYAASALDTAEKELASLREQLSGIRSIEEARERSLDNARKTAEAERLVGEQLQAAIRDRASATEQAQQTLLELRRQAGIQQAITKFGAESAEVAALRTSAEREANAELVRGMNISEDLKQELLNAWEAARGIAGVDLAPGISAAAQAAMTLASQLDISLQRALQMQGMISDRPTQDVFDPRDPRNSGSEAATERARQRIESGELTRSSIPTVPRISGGGGGGSGGGSAGTDPYASDLEALVQSLRTEREVIEQDYLSRQEVLTDRRAQELLGIEAHNETKARLEREYQEQISSIEAAAHAAQIRDTADLFGALEGIAQAGGSKLAKVAALAGGIRATANAYVAATEALATPGLSLPGRLAAYGTVLATGLQAAAKVKAAGGGGGGGGVSGGVSAAPTTPEQQAPQRVILQGLDPNALFTGEMVSKIFDGIFDENKRRGGVIVVST